MGAVVRDAAAPARGPLALAGLAILLVLAVPVFSLRLGVADAGNDPTSQTTRRAYDLLASGFGPGSSGPLLVVAEIDGPEQRAAIDRLATDLAGDAGRAAGQSGRRPTRPAPRR